MSQSSQYYHNVNGPHTYVTPQDLILAPNSTVEQRRQTVRGDPSLLAPGAVHTSYYLPKPTPQSVLSGSISMPEPQHLQYFPRRAQFCGNPSFAPILFSVDGVPGPYLSDIVKGRVVIDAANDAVFEWHGWKATPWTLDWPGLRDESSRIYTHGVDGKPLTRIALARELASCIGLIMQKAKAGDPRYVQQFRSTRDEKEWAFHRIRYSDIRLVSLNYYQRNWVPVLALDVEV